MKLTQPQITILQATARGEVFTKFTAKGDPQTYRNKNGRQEKVNRGVERFLHSKGLTIRPAGQVGVHQDIKHLITDKGQIELAKYQR